VPVGAVPILIALVGWFWPREPARRPSPERAPRGELALGEQP